MHDARNENQLTPNRDIPTERQRSLPEVIQRCSSVEMELLNVAGRCFSASYRALSLKNSRGSEIDLLARESISAAITDSALEPVDIYFEDHVVQASNASGTVFIDEVDGTRNFERKIGNPNFAFAYTPKTGLEITLDDLDLAFVKSYATKEEYFGVKDKGAVHFHALGDKTSTIRSSDQTNFADALVYLRHGYGFADKQLKQTLPLLLLAGDTRAFDNTVIELCEIARGGADLLIEARGESPIHNLLAYPILKEAGALMTDLEGNDAGAFVATQNGTFNFIVAANETLLQHAVLLLRQIRNGEDEARIVELLNSLRERYEGPLG